MPERPLQEVVLQWSCEGRALWGVLARPAASPVADTAVLIVVGGPQYRVGSHRQFVSLARALAAAGYPALRFDHRGMGDSDGEQRSFEHIEADLRSALDTLQQAVPESRQLVVWGLCDAASAALMFGTADARVVGIVATNPWVRSDASLAAARVKHYYGARLLQREFWSKVAAGRFEWRDSLRALANNLRSARGHGPDAAGQTLPFQTRMANAMASFNGSVLLIISGNDITAQEFLQHSSSDAHWRGLLERRNVQRIDLPQADHTFSSRDWMSQVEQATLGWLHGLARPHATAGTAIREGA
jgi:exosortase A-associated hydrolase 1